MKKLQFLANILLGIVGALLLYYSILVILEARAG